MQRNERMPVWKRGLVIGWLVAAAGAAGPAGAGLALVGNENGGTISPTTSSLSVSMSEIVPPFSLPTSRTTRCW